MNKGALLVEAAFVEVIVGTTVSTFVIYDLSGGSSQRALLARNKVFDVVLHADHIFDFLAFCQRLQNLFVLHYSYVKLVDIVFTVG
jgi:hypothetical protein